MSAKKSDKKFPVLTSQRLKLDRLTQKDINNIYSIFSDPAVIEHYDVEIFKDKNEASELIKYFNALYDGDGGIRWAIRDKKTGKFIGSCGYSNWNPFDHSAVISYELAKAHWGKGYASEALQCIINFIFDESFHFYVHRIEALILPSNQPSEILAKRHHFEFEGTLKEKCYWNNSFHDMNMFGLLRKNWV
jgi:ribosomal-protein-alanine N-acetyltransferase